jgi:hypothetical protein
MARGLVYRPRRSRAHPVVAGRRVKGERLGTSPEIRLNEYLRAAMHAYLVRVVLATGGNVREAARIAGKNRTDFYKLLARAGVDLAQMRALCGCDTGYRAATPAEVRMARTEFDAAWRSFVTHGRSS